MHQDWRQIRSHPTLLHPVHLRYKRLLPQLTRFIFIKLLVDVDFRVFGKQNTWTTLLLQLTILRCPLHFECLEFNKTFLLFRSLLQYFLHFFLIFFYLATPIILYVQFIFLYYILLQYLSFLRHTDRICLTIIHLRALPEHHMLYHRSHRIRSQTSSREVLLGGEFPRLLPLRDVPM